MKQFLREVAWVCKAIALAVGIPLAGWWIWYVWSHS